MRGLREAELKRHAGEIYYRRMKGLITIDAILESVRVGVRRGKPATLFLRQRIKEEPLPQGSFRNAVLDGIRGWNPQIVVFDGKKQR